MPYNVCDVYNAIPPSIILLDTFLPPHWNEVAIHQRRVAHCESVPDSKVHGAPCWPHELCYLGYVSGWVSTCCMKINTAIKSGLHIEKYSAPRYGMSIFSNYSRHHIALPWRQMWSVDYEWKVSLIARFMRPTWSPPGADRTQVGPMLVPWTLLSGMFILCCFLGVCNMMFNC